MKIAMGCDHAAYQLKEQVKAYVESLGHEVHDFGTFDESSVDYPDYAFFVGKAVVNGEADRGILLCGTGIGIGIAANKIPGIRAALCHDLFSAEASRQHNNANILTMGARVIKPELAMQIVEIWLKTEFEGGRHQRRLDKITNIEDTMAVERAQELANIVSSAAEGQTK
jgi:ribose 5-phosphate isomerase B